MVLRRNVPAAKLAAYVERVVAEVPPLNDEQVNRIALLLVLPISVSKRVTP